jgi:hypothetical protein
MMVDDNTADRRALGLVTIEIARNFGDRRFVEYLPEAARMSTDELVRSESPTHPANLICELCRLFYGM